MDIGKGLARGTEHCWHFIGYKITYGMFLPGTALAMERKFESKGIDPHPSQATGETGKQHFIMKLRIPAMD